MKKKKNKRKTIKNIKKSHTRKALKMDWDDLVYKIISLEQKHLKKFKKENLIIIDVYESEKAKRMVEMCGFMKVSHRKFYDIVDK